MSLEKHISYWGKWNFEAIEPYYLGPVRSGI